MSGRSPASTIGICEGRIAIDIGDWIVFQTNARLTNEKASSIVAVGTKDARTVSQIFPFGRLGKGAASMCLPKPNAELTTAFVVDSPTTGRIFSASDCFEPKGVNNPITPAFGGRSVEAGLPLARE